jgi:serine/threonine-protein kinase
MSVLSPGDRVGDRYLIEEEVGRGGMQEVYRAIDETLNREVAVKVPQDARVARKFKESAVISARVNHPNVAKTLDYFEDSSGRFFMVEELVLGMNLRQVASHFDRVDPHTAAHVLHHLARGVAASHRAGVVHRDLKPGNVLVAGGLAFSAVKITDFGIARMAAEEIGAAVSGGEETTQSSRTARGQIAYMAPEVIGAPRVPSMPADVWAIAALAWELLTGTPPFGTGYAAVAAIVMGKMLPLPPAVAGHAQFGGLAKGVHDVVLKCLEADPTKRPTAEQLAKICDDLCYLPPVGRETGTVDNFPRFSGGKYGFIQSEAGAGVFFHTRSVVGPKPKVGDPVWFMKFQGQPKPRAIPVVPMKAIGK